MPGRRPVPDAIKDLTGSHNKRNPNSPKFHSVSSVELGNRTWFKRVSADIYAKDMWDEVLPDLVTNGLINRANAALFGAYCLAFARWQHAEDGVEDNGLTIEIPLLNKKGELVGEKRVVNPLVSIAQSHRSDMFRIGIEFGLTPAAATRVTAGVQPSSADDDFMSPPEEDDAGTGASAKPN